MAWQAEKRLHPRWRRAGRVRRQDFVVCRQRRQGGLPHTERHRHGLTDVEGLVEGQPAQAVRVEVVRWEKRLCTQERRLKRDRGCYFQMLFPVIRKLS